jgi:hypothetical protein
MVRRAWLSHATARHDGQAMDPREDLVFNALTNEMRSIFAGLGLEGDFWNPRSDSFG